MGHNWINGEWEQGNGKRLEIKNPATAEIEEIVFEADDLQVKKAAESAYQAFSSNSWRYNFKLRKKVLEKAASILEEKAEKVATIESIDTGKPIKEARVDVEDVVHCLRYYAGLIPDSLSKTLKMEDGTESEIKSEPIGVCGLIVPWNFPLLLGVWKLAPALAAGNAVVFKPSELTPMSMIEFTKALMEAGIPDGIFNLVIGGREVGQAIVENPRVKKISFTGSVETGKRIYQRCAEDLKKVSLELGGKSPLIVWNDVDIEKTAEWAVFGALFNQGEVCVAAPRLLLHQDIYDPLKKVLLEKISQVNIGDPLKEGTEFGPLISESHVKKVTAYIEKGLEGGASLLYGGKVLAEKKGYFIEPAVFEEVDQSMEIVQEEIFGPVITLQSFETKEEAVELANGTNYGLAAGIFTESSERGRWIAERLEAGIIWINSYHTPYVDAPWGGVKQSGIGRELGPEGLISFTEYKHVNKSVSIDSLGWYQFKR